MKTASTMTSEVQTIKNDPIGKGLDSFALRLIWVAKPKHRLYFGLREPALP
jgi:hypothetical protein